MNLQNKVREEPWRKVWDEVWLKTDAHLYHHIDTKLRQQIRKEIYVPMKNMILQNIAEKIKTELL
jgi:hypothetical protein